MNCSFESLGLAAPLLRAVSEEGYTHPTPIQQRAIPSILEGRDVLAGAQTGTGKTAGFTLPLLQRLASCVSNSTAPAHHPIRALVLTPTRELAAQVEQSVRTYGRHVTLRSCVVFGGVGMTPQVATLRRGVDILVATPGRLLDHVQQKTVDLSRVEILVLDEADRMLDMGFIRDIRKVLALLPAARQNLLFSATFSDEIRRLADGLLRNPVAIEVARRNAEAELVKQTVHPIAHDQKRHLLAHLIRAGGWDQVLVFSRTKHGANRLAEHLQRDGLSSTAIHGNKSQPQRLKALTDFKRGEVRVLVATDIAARGLDIDGLPHVVNFDLPHVAEDYVHRIGRTGRAGNRGHAISLVSPEERSELAAIERLIGRRIELAYASGFESVRRPTETVIRPDAMPAPHGPRVRRGEDSNARKTSRPGRMARSKPRQEQRPAASGHGKFNAPIRPEQSTRPAHHNAQAPHPRHPRAILLGGTARASE